MNTGTKSISIHCKDAVYVFCFSLVMLSTDLSNSNIKNKIQEVDFVRSCVTRSCFSIHLLQKGINNGGDLPTKFLEEMYQQLKKKPFLHRTDILALKYDFFHGPLQVMSESLLKKLVPVHCTSKDK